ncbi:MAG: hypothetical protein OQK52_11155, partial [Ignavibacteriaceae bacterium]|nr:hypothetical protein [Ignavibacteriaceae bacterium]
IHSSFNFYLNDLFIFQVFNCVFHFKTSSTLSFMNDYTTNCTSLTHKFINNYICYNDINKH